MRRTPLAATRRATRLLTGLAVAVCAAAAVAACGNFESPTLVTLDEDDGVPAVAVNGETVSGIDVAACAGSELVGDFTVDYSETPSGGCLVTFNEEVVIFDEESARMANETLGDQPILGISGIRMRVTAFSLSDADSGASYDTGPANVSGLALIVDGVLLDADLDGPFPQEVAVGQTTVDNVTDSVGSGTAVSADLDLAVTLTSAGRAAFPTNLSITFLAQPEVDLAVALD